MGLRLDLDLASSLNIASTLKFISSNFRIYIVAFILSISTKLAQSSFQDAMHITAILGENVVFNCPVDFPSDQPVPYVLQWEKKVGDSGSDIPIFIWYENYPTHSGEGYEGRVARVSPDSPYGLASLNLTNIRESDQGWYECNVVFLNRPPSTQSKNGTWFHLDVHAPPRFVITPEEIIYVNVGDAIILNCQADGTPSPEIVWFKDENPVDLSAPTTGVFNEGTELRISNLRHEDIGDYTCIARNGEGQISHTARVIIAGKGAAVIMTPPTNQTRLEGEKLEFPCTAKALPGNLTITWSKDGQVFHEDDHLKSRITIKKDGTLVISPVSSEDSGHYKCEVSNGIGNPQVASAFLNVEYPAKVTFTPTVQYLPFRLGGVVQCYIKANPPLQYVTWTKDKRLLEPYQTKDIIVMNNGSLLFTRVNQNHQGRYMCTPYNAQGTQGSSGHMEVLVRKPPEFNLRPKELYQRKIGDSVEMHCDAFESEGTSKPNLRWERKDGQPLPKNRVRYSGGNITIDGLRRTDFGHYQCLAENEVATVASEAELMVEGTQPHAPSNVSVNATEHTATIVWVPGYSGGPDYKQEYTIWYREVGTSEWFRTPVTESITHTTITDLRSSTLYEFQVVGKNALGEGMLSKIITARTLDPTSSATNVESPKSESTFQSPSAADVLDCSNIISPTDSSLGAFFIHTERGARPGPPRNLSIQELDNGFMITWDPPEERPEMVKYYTIMYKTDADWRDLTKNYKIRSDETKYFIKNMVGGRTYFLRVIAHSNNTHESSEEYKYSVPARVKQKAITAGVVGGILFFIVAIILSICAVKICNKRKRRKQEKAYNMVACRITDARNGGQISTVRQVPLNKCSRGGVSRIARLFNIMPHLAQPRTRTKDPEYVHRVRPISRAPDGRFIISSSRSSSVSSSVDDGGFLTHPAFRRSDLSIDSHVAQAQVPAVSIIYSSHTPFLSSSPATTVSPMSPAYFSDLSSVKPGSIERTLRSIHEQYSHELPSLQAIQEEWSHSPTKVIRPRTKRIRYITETMLDNSSSSGLGSKNTSQQTSSTVDWKLPPYRYPPPPAPQPPIKPHYLRTWLDYTPSPTQSMVSNKPLSVDDHYEFDPIFPASPTPTELVLTPLPPAIRVKPMQQMTKQEEIEARVQAMKEEFYEYKRRQAQMKRLKDLESIC